MGDNNRRVETQPVDHSTRLTRAPGTGASPGYQMAIRLAKNGASREDLMAGCGLSLAEAELVQRLHGAGRS